MLNPWSPLAFFSQKIVSTMTADITLSAIIEFAAFLVNFTYFSHLANDAYWSGHALIIPQEGVKDDPLSGQTTNSRRSAW